MGNALLILCSKISTIKYLLLNCVKIKKLKHMKKFTLSLIAIIAMSLSASAQNSFGIKAGANISSLSWNEKSVMSDDTLSSKLDKLESILLFK